jgi:hypothetical protein
MKIILFIFTFGLLFACQTSVEKEFTMDELSKPSIRYQSVEDTINKLRANIFAFDSISYFSKQLVDTLGISKQGVHRISTLLFPDRFNPIKSDKWYGITSSDSFVYKHWMYVDTNVSENTFYNWLDNFGDKHLSLKFGDKIRVSPNAFVLLLQHRSLLLMESKNQLNKDDILTLLDTLGFGSTWKYVLFQNKGKKTEWFEQLNISLKNENSKP